MNYLHKETGFIDTREGWIASYVPEELKARGLTAEQAFEEEELDTLVATDEATDAERDSMIRVL